MRRRVNLDQVASGPIRPAALAALVEALKAGGGDPSRTYHEALDARERLEIARSQIAEILGARSREVVFTSGRAESVATVIAGAGLPQVASVVEHSSIREGVARVGGVLIGADHMGRIDPAELTGVEGVALVHLQWANHEVGTRQLVDETVGLARERGALVHLDASLGAGHEPLSFRDLDVDFMTIEATAFGGPPGVGALLIRRGLRIDPLLVGGDQERARRAGLENVAGAAAMAAALAEAAEELRSEPERERQLTDALSEAALCQPDVSLLGDDVHRAPQLICLAVDGIEPQQLVFIRIARAVSRARSDGCRRAPLPTAIGRLVLRSRRRGAIWVGFRVVARIAPCPTKLRRYYGAP